jgi:hypothetical protein
LKADAGPGGFDTQLSIDYRGEFGGVAGVLDLTAGHQIRSATGSSRKLPGECLQWVESCRSLEIAIGEAHPFRCALEGGLKWLVES